MCPYSRCKAKDLALENPVQVWEQLQSKQSHRTSHSTKHHDRSPVKDPIPVKRSKMTKDHGRKTSKLEDSMDGGDSDTGSYKHVPSDKSEESDLEPVESITQALLEEAQYQTVKVSSTRERKQAMETPKWNESVSTISEFNSSLIVTDSPSDDSIVPKEEEIDEDTQHGAYDAAGAQSKKASAHDPMACLVYTRTGVIQRGILKLKAYIAFNHGYPEVIAKNTYGHKILINAAQYLQATPIEKCMRTNKGYLSALVGLIDAHASLFHRDIKDAACKNIVGYCTASHLSSSHHHRASEPNLFHVTVTRILSKNTKKVLVLPKVLILSICNASALAATLDINLLRTNGIHGNIASDRKAAGRSDRELLQKVNLGEEGNVSDGILIVNWVMAHQTSDPHWQDSAAT
ncbi:hypothetical protein BDR06DRAFT_976980 [Suillus hirtellus]|nr:hypothetical protein BDR06DRAFT_976980 [Suillus hirtellus]